jgi:predicted ATPase
MHCRRAFTEELIDAAFSPNFRKTDLRKHRIKILMEQERSLFPATLAEIEREDAQAAYVSLFSKHSELIQRFSPRDVTPVNSALVDEINATRMKMAELMDRVQTLNSASSR